MPVDQAEFNALMKIPAFTAELETVRKEVQAAQPVAAVSN